MKHLEKLKRILEHFDVKLVNRGNPSEYYAQLLDNEEIVVEYATTGTLEDVIDQLHWDAQHLAGEW